LVAVMMAPATGPVWMALLVAVCGAPSGTREAVPEAPGLSRAGAPIWALVGVIETRIVIVLDCPCKRLKPDQVTVWPAARVVPTADETDTIETPAGRVSVTVTPVMG